MTPRLTLTVNLITCGLQIFLLVALIRLVRVYKRLYRELAQRLARAELELEWLKDGVYGPTSRVDFCVKCGAPLAGSWTEHKPGCEIGRMIEAAKKGEIH